LDHLRSGTSVGPEIPVPCVPALEVSAAFPIDPEGFAGKPAGQNSDEPCCEVGAFLADCPESFGLGDVGQFVVSEVRGLSSTAGHDGHCFSESQRLERTGMGILRARSFALDERIYFLARRPEQWRFQPPVNTTTDLVTVR